VGVTRLKMRGVSRYLILLWLVACQSSAPEVYCRAIEPSPQNPLLSGGFLCYERRDQCTGACQASGPPRWHCYSSEGSKFDPISGVKTCWPTRAMCAASRPSFEGVSVSDCTPVDSVYCATSRSGGLSCYADEASCKRTEAGIRGAVTALGPPAQACTRRR
jgi:hypothetical protein